LADNGNIYLGVNVEFSSMPLDNAIHAEQFAISNAAFNGAKSLRLLAASATPCGHCRQFCKELHLSDELRVVFGTPSQSLMHVPLTDMLPYGFGPRELGVFEKTLLAHRPADAAARLFDIVETKTYHSSALHHRLKLSSSSTGGASSSSSSSSSSTSTSATTAVVVTTSSIQHPDDATIEQLKALAVNAAQQSYSPYTNSPAGCAILLRNATTTTTTTTTPDAQQQQQQHSFAFGYYIESCAYNPSMTAFRAALVDVTMQNRDWCDIAAVVIAELHHAKVLFWFVVVRTFVSSLVTLF
jgi:cytidine deaminase